MKVSPAIAQPSRKPQSESRPNPWVLLLLGVFPLLVLELAPLPMVRAFENAVYDARMKLRQQLDPRPLDPRIRLVGISELEEEYLDQDLISRQAHIDLLGRLREWGAASATFDIFFQDERPTDDLLAMAFAGDDLPVITAYHFMGEERTVRPPGNPPEDFADSIALAESSTDAPALRAEVMAVDDYLQELRRVEQEQSALRHLPPGTGGRMATEELADLHDTTLWTREVRAMLLRRWFQLTQRLGEAAGGSPPAAADFRMLAPRPMMAAPALGFANLDKGREEVVRRVPLVYRWRDQLFPQLSLATALQYYGVAPGEVMVEWGRAIRFTPRRNATGEIRIPVDDSGRYLVNYREAETFLGRSPLLTAVLRPELASAPIDAAGGRAAFFRGAVVLVGEVIAGGRATDVEPIPLQAQFPMVGLHANILDNVLRGDFLHETNRPTRLALALLLGIAMAGLFRRFSFGRAAQLAGVLAVLYVLAQFAAFQAAGWVLPVVAPLFGMVGSTLLFFGYIIVVKDRDRRLVRDVFLKSVSPRIGEEILRNYNDAAIWGAQREITVLFVDVRGYTTMSETHGPEVVLQLLEEFYDTVSECVFRHDGQVNKFLGDAVLALFGALAEESGDHALRASCAAVEIQAAMQQFNQSDFVARTGVRLNTGAGVNTGDATVGLVGRRRIRIEYTALGDAVNIASRLQTNASEGEVILSDETMRQAGGEAELCRKFPALRVAPPESLTVKGRQQPIIVHRLMLPAPESRVIARPPTPPETP